MTVAITGATGHLGRLAIAALKTKLASAQLVALVRTPEKAQDLGVAVRQADYHAPATWPAALDGVDTLVLISSNDFNDRAGQHRTVIAEAKKAGVGRIVYTSILKANTSPMLLAADHLATENAIAESGLTSTILRNGWYTENYVGTLPGAIAAGALAGSAGTGKISAATRQDYADAIAVVASSEGHAGKVYELAGDTSFTMADLAAVVSKAIGKSVLYHDMPKQDYATLLQSVGLPQGVAAVFADADASIAKGALVDDSKTLSTLIGRPTTPMEITITEALKHMS